MKSSTYIELEANIDHLNTLCGHTLSMTSYPDGWEISSYGRNTLLNTARGHVLDKELSLCVEKAIKTCWERMT